MTIKGSATIELTNADGTKQVIKHDNMITNAVNDMFRSYMGDMPLIHKLNFYDNAYVDTIFGGLLLFDDRLNDDASDYAIPSTKITGYASDTAYGGNDLSRGSHNLAESGLQEDGSYKLVWDFGTSQGNGNIQSIALCPLAMGKIGASDAPVISERVSYRLGEEVYTNNNSSSGKGAFSPYYRLIDGTVDGVDVGYLYLVAIVGEYIYAVDNRNVDYYYRDKDYNLVGNGGILKLYKFKFQFNSVSISATTGRAKYVETIEVQIPTEIVNLAYTTTDGYGRGVVGIHFNKRDNKLIVFPYSLNTALAPNATLPYVDIDLVDNYKVTNYTMTNTTNQSLSIRGLCFSTYGQRYGLYVSNDHILMIGGTGADARMYVINRTDNAKVVKVKIGGEDFVPYNLNYEKALNFCPKLINNNTAVVAFGTFGIHGGYEPYDMYIIDLTTGVAKKCNTVTNSNRGKVINITRPIMTDGAIVYDGDDYVACVPKLNPFILTTKNNLDTPVVKTASQTMKITYTLTESEGV